VHWEDSLKLIDKRIKELQAVHREAGEQDATSDIGEMLARFEKVSKKAFELR